MPAVGSPVLAEEGPAAGANAVVELPALSAVEGPAPSAVEGPAPSAVEGPAPSAVEGPAGRFVEEGADTRLWAVIGCWVERKNHQPNATSKQPSSITRLSLIFD